MKKNKLQLQLQCIIILNYLPVYFTVFTLIYMDFYFHLQTKSEQADEIKSTLTQIDL